jgi:hypothetical protein
MHLRDFMTLLYFVVAAIVLGIISWVTLSPTVKWVTPIIALGLISVGLGVNSIVLVRHTDKKIEAINETLRTIGQVQEELQKEQKEQTSSRSHIVPTLQAFSQLYLDYLAKQETGEENQKEIGHEAKS